jgi:hypothetical protein
MIERSRVSFIITENENVILCHIAVESISTVIISFSLHFEITFKNSYNYAILIRTTSY